MVVRCRLAQPLRSTAALVVDQSLLWRRLLGLVDSTRVRLAFGWHRLRCPHPSARDDEHLREGACVVADSSTSARTRHSNEATPVARLCVLPQFLLWLHTSVLCRSLGADR